MNKYFENVSTLEELRKQYKELLKLHYPDNGWKWQPRRTEYSGIEKDTQADIFL